MLRERQKRNILTTLLLSQGVPMIAHGDELGRTQQGNNNVYCQDNELSWIDWDAARDNDVLTVFTASLTALRAAHPIFRRQRFFQGRPIQGSNKEDIAWLHPDGRDMADKDWHADSPSLMVYLNGEGIPDREPLGERVRGRLVPAAVQRRAPPDHLHAARTRATAGAWQAVVDTNDPLLANARRRYPRPAAGSSGSPRARSRLRVLRSARRRPARARTTDTLRRWRRSTPGWSRPCSLPPGFAPPILLEHGDLRARILTRADLAEDVRGINASLELIPRTRGGDWPTEAVTEEFDFADLVWHEVRVPRRLLVLLRRLRRGGRLPRLRLPLPDGRRTPLRADLIHHDVDVSWWVTPEAYDRGHYVGLYRALQVWVTTDYPFTTPYFSNREIPA